MQSRTLVVASACLAIAFAPVDYSLRILLCHILVGVVAAPPRRVLSLELAPRRTRPSAPLGRSYACGSDAEPAATCAICLDPIVVQGWLLPCGHRFHERCVLRVVLQCVCVRCPLCKGALVSPF